jgi:DNA-binding transcriptional LysR family regulator
MASWDPHPDLLRTFLEVRRLGSLTRAAETLYISQSAVTRRLDRLERSLGLALFERLGRRLRLTEAGEALAAEAQGLVGSLDRLAEAIQARTSGAHGRLRLGASTTPGLYLLPPLVLRYQQQHPSVDVRLSVENSLHIEQKLLVNDLDLGFVGAHLSHAAMRLQPAFQDEIVVYAAATHPLARHASVSARDLAQVTCIAREPGSATRKLVDRWLARRRVTLHKVLEIGCPEAAKPLVRAGLGFSYLSSRGLEGHGGAGLVRLKVAGLSLSRPIYLAMHARKVPSPAMAAFLTLVLGRRTAPA